MPTDVLEQPIEVDEAPLEPAKNADNETAPESKYQKSPGPPRKTIWQEIFEGHEEFLGLTPD